MAGAKALVLLNALALLVAGAIVTRMAHPSLRRWVALSLMAQTGVLLLVGPAHPDGLAVALLIVACSNRRVLVSGIAIGLACATKQTAWFVAAPLLVLAFRGGSRPGLGFAATAASSFVLVNLPFLVKAPAAWLSGILAPEAGPEFTIGSGPIRFFGDPGTAVGAVTTGATALMILTVLAGCVMAWRGRDGWAHAGVIVASLGLWDGPRSLAAYIALLGVVAVSICVVRVGRPRRLLRCRRPRGFLPIPRAAAAGSQDDHRARVPLTEHSISAVTGRRLPRCSLWGWRPNDYSLPPRSWLSVKRAGSGS